MAYLSSATWSIQPYNYSSKGFIAGATRIRLSTNSQETLAAQTVTIRTLLSRGTESGSGSLGTYTTNISKMTPNTNIYIDIPAEYWGRDNLPYIPSSGATVSIRLSYKDAQRVTNETIALTHLFELSTIRKCFSSISGVSFSTLPSSLSFGEIFSTKLSGVPSYSGCKTFFETPNGSWISIATSQSSGSSMSGVLPDSYKSTFNSSPIGTRIKAKLFDTRIGEAPSNAATIGEIISSYIPINVSDDMRPTATNSVSNNSSAIQSKFGCIVQSQSVVKFTSSASLKYSATLNSHQVKINNHTLNYTTTSANGTTGPIATAGSHNIVTTAKDSRNQTATATTAFTVVEWKNPVITTFTVKRCNSSGTLDDQGDCAKVAYNVSISPVNNRNDQAVKVKYKKSGTSTYTERTVSISNYTSSGSFVLTDIDTESAYDFVIEVTDYFTTSTKSVKLSAAFVLLDFHSAGKGVGIGRVSVANKLSVGLPTEFDSTVNAVGNASTDGGITARGGWASIENGNSDNAYKSLFFQDRNSPYVNGCFIRAYDGDENGSIMAIRPGGALIAGGGEYATNRYSIGDIPANSEATFIGADGNIFIESGANTIANRKTWKFGNDGNITTPSGGLINGVDIEKVTKIGGTSSSASVQQSATNPVIIRTDGTSHGDFALAVNASRIQLYDYNNSQSVLEVKPTSYQAGETVTLNNIICPGHVTNSRMAIDFQICLPRVTTGRSATLSLPASNGLSVRKGTSGYLGGSQYIDVVGGSSGIFTITATPNASGLYVRIQRNTAWNDITNNTALSIQINGTITFS